MTNFELYARELAWPVDWTAVYHRTAPLLVEIGFGGGHFLAELAQQRPEANVLGVEIARPAIRRGLKKLQTAGVSNGRVLQASAEYLLWACCAPGVVSEVFINFPDPWPKGKQTHRRLINPRFLALLAARLPAGGRLHIATDVADYAHAIATDLAQSLHFESVYETPFVTEVDGRLPNGRVRTKYEQLALAAGATCHYFTWQRNDTPAAHEFPIPQETPMPHAILHSPLSLPEIADRFTPLHDTAGEIHIRLPMLFKSQQEHLLLVEAYINEEPISQRVGLLLKQRADGHYLIGLSEMGFPRPTPGVQLAIACLARWLMTLHIDTAVSHHNLPYSLDPSSVTRKP
ncbi:MAG: tRNA (guanosine(46)-N7)-methyltransferase TrmB [Anaerolineae bacterium]|nr:tRNA (guanosine(46)-N7)-methyltransferase TrmB [Anaerolineae bacterium]